MRKAFSLNALIHLPAYYLLYLLQLVRKPARLIQRVKFEEHSVVDPLKLSKLSSHCDFTVAAPNIYASSSSTPIYCLTMEPLFHLKSLQVTFSHEIERAFLPSRGNCLYAQPVLPSLARFLVTILSSLKDYFLHVLLDSRSWLVCFHPVSRHIF